MTDLEAWLTALAGASYSPNTLRQRRFFLGHFLAAHPDPWAVTTDEVSAWLAADQRWTPATRAAARGSLGSFYRWAMKTGRTERNPVKDTNAPRVSRGVPRPAPERVLTAALARATPRVRMMLLLAAYGGLRRAEVAALGVGDIDDPWLHVLGKGHKVRLVPIHPIVADELEHYLPTVTGRWLFPAADGGHLSPDRVGALMSDALGPGWTAHTLRHRFGTRLYAGTHDVFQAQTLLGHASAATTQRYVAVPDEAMFAAVAAIP